MRGRDLRRYGREKPIYDAAAIAEADPILVPVLGPANGFRCLMDGSPLYGRRRLWCGQACKDAFRTDLARARARRSSSGAR